MTDRWTDTKDWTGKENGQDLTSWVDRPCPGCGESFLYCIKLVNTEGNHQHTKYICCNWDCRWSGWTVPGG